MSEPNTSAIYENLPDNSHKAREERKQKAATTTPVPEDKRVSKAVVSGKVKVKEDKVRKLTDIFISEDVGNVKSYIIYDVLIPTIKKTLYDIVVNSLDISLFGGRGGKRSNADKVSFRDYNSMSRRDRDDRDRDRDRGSSRSGGVHSYDSIVFDTRGDAEVVLERMDELLETYEQVRVADLFELVGKTGDWTDNNYGWVNLRNADIVRVYDGYKIKLPRAQPLR